MLWATGGTFGAGFGGMDRVPPARDSNGPASMAERKDRARGGTVRGGTTSGGKMRLGDNPLFVASGFEWFTASRSVVVEYWLTRC